VNQRVIEHAETVRRIHQAERELARLTALVAAGRGGLEKPRDKVAEKLAALRGTP
jgi:hypothetical protein